MYKQTTARAVSDARSTEYVCGCAASVDELVCGNGRADGRALRIGWRLRKPGTALIALTFVAAAAVGKPAAHSADLPNFHAVHPFLLRGGEPSGEGLRLLAQRGVKTIVDLRASPRQLAQERKQATALGLRWVNLPMSDKAPTRAEVNTFLRLVDDPRARPVFVHCAHGSDRTGCLVGIYRVTHDGWTYDQAYQEMRRYWFGPQYHQLSATVRRYARR